MRALVAGFIFAVMPAEAQWQLPDLLPVLPPGAAACNKAQTHCVVNRSDWMSDKFALLLAERELNLRAAEIADLKEQLAAETAKKTVRCADVKPERKS